MALSLGIGKTVPVAWLHVPLITLQFYYTPNASLLSNQIIIIMATIGGVGVQ